MSKKKLVFLTGSGISAESGIPTFRMAADSTWENYDVKTVCTHTAWQLNYWHVQQFYNMLRVKYSNAEPNDGHKIIADLEKYFDVTVITQNVDNLHEKAGSTNIVHLHGEIMKCCSENDTENKECWITLPHEGFGESGLEIPEDTLAKDGSLLRPYIVFFEEMVPNMDIAEKIVQEADILVIIGTSLSVYPAASLICEHDVMKPLYIIDPWDDITNQLIIENQPTIHICKGAGEGMKELYDILTNVAENS